jgi:flagellar export protein FliJ
MKRFEFSLERVRQFRKLQMETEQAQLEQARARLEAVEAMISELNRQRSLADDVSRRLRSSSGSVSMPDVAGHSQFAVYLQRMEHALISRRQQAALEMERQRHVLLEARKRYEMLDRFRDASRSAWQVEFAREQENMAGELFLAKWNRAQRSAAGEATAGVTATSVRVYRGG